MSDDTDIPRRDGAPRAAAPDGVSSSDAGLSVGMRAHVRAAVAGVARGRAAGDGADARAELRAAVTAYARQLRIDGAPPERMLVAVKTAVRGVEDGAFASDEGAALHADVVRWSIQAYFGTPAADRGA